MKRLFTTIMACMAFACMMAQGWPENYGGVMLQGFYWDYYDDAEWGTWSRLESQAGELEGYIDLIWIPNSGQTKPNEWNIEGHNRDMGYMPCYWLQHNSCFGTQAELTSMISTYKAIGIGIIEDVVINHKNGLSNWCDFPNENVTGTKGTYTLNWTLADICYNDNGGACIANGYNVTGAADTGDDFDGCRDLDHTGANVQQNVKTYLDYLQNELGYAGFRYDMVKGYGPQYVGIYNAYAKPTFSVGEYWDDWGGTTWWVNGTKQNGVIQSAAFDFPLKFLINNAFKDGFNQSALNTQGMAGSTDFQRYSVTFVDNHDTYRDGTCMNNEHNVLAANAFILSMPGTPCIFLPHWKTHKAALKRMIAARKAAGITNQSSFESYECNDGGGRSFIVHGTNANILLLLGNCGDYDTSGYTSVWNGDENNWNFQMFVSDTVTEGVLNGIPSGANINMGTACVDMASGTYYQTVTVNVSPSDDFTTLVYTEDGSDPTLNSSLISSSGKEFIYNTVGTHTLKVGVKGANGVRDIQTYQYVITNVELADITVYVEANRYPIKLYAWNGNGELFGGFPGKQMEHTACINGKAWFYETIGNQSSINLVVSDGSNQSADFTGVTSNVFVSYDGDDHTLTDKTSAYAGYPQAWYEQGEICAFFEIPNGWFDNWNDICAYAYNGETEYTDVWKDGLRGDGCTFLGYNESGKQIWKWTCTKSVTGQPATIIFNSASNNNQTENLRFVNGAWYSAESYIGSHKTEPISTAVDPSTEVTLADLGTPTIATNWNGKSENVAQKTSYETMSKEFSLDAGSYIIQAIVRGTEGKTVTLSAKDKSAMVTLTGMDGAISTVQPNGIVESYATGVNNGWHKAELFITLTDAEKVLVSLTSAATTWQLGALKVLPGITKTKATTGVDLASNAYIDVTNDTYFSFYERGLNLNALIKATGGTLPALLPYNVIVDGTCANLLLTDGNYSFKNNESFTATSVSYDRNFTVRSTICLPFALTEEEASEAGTFWELDSYDSGTGNICFKKVSSTEANTPYIFEAAVEHPFLSLAGKIVPVSSLVTVTKDNVSFVGVNEQQILKSNENVTIYGYRQNDGFVMVGTGDGARINPFRAYLQIPTSMVPNANARMLVLFDGEDGDVTGIQYVTPVAEPVEQQPIYNISGQRVITPLQKGIYIKGGKKFIVK